MITQTRDAAPMIRGVVDGQIVEQYDGLVEWIRSSTSPVEGEAKLIGVAGCARRVGASSVAANLAVAAARRCNRPVVLLDLSGTNPLLAEQFAESKDLGLADGHTERAGFTNTSPIPNLSLLTLNEAAAQVSMDAEGRELTAFLRELQYEYGFIVVDLPPADSWHSLAIAASLHGVVVVVDSKSERQAAVRAMQGLVRANATVLGVILNNYCRDVPGWLNARH